MSIIDLVPEYIRSLIPYVPGKPIEEVEREYGVRDSVKLASNENPLGPSAKAMAVWTAVVDLPVPPFSLAKTMKCCWPMAC